MKLIKSFFTILIAASMASAQQSLTSDLLEKSAIRFSLNSEGQLEGDAREQWLQWIGDNQYIGMAEVHNSAQLSLFTKALLNTLDEKGFEHFVMEMGPNTAAILQETTANFEQAPANIKKINQAYGKKSSYRTPLVFANKIEDAVFLQEAAKLGFTLWGIDQEYDGSYTMLLDDIYKRSSNRDGSFTSAYEKARSTFNKVLYKKKYCEYLSNKEINNFFSMIEDEDLIKVIEDIRMSWDIYCKHTQGGSNQLRANYMKKNFDSYTSTHGKDAKVFLKMGNVHMTHGTSPFGVNDMGKHITEISKKEDKGFLIMRELISYRNGKSNIGKSGWKSVTMLLELGRKDQWTVVDLRPFREKVASGELTTNNKYAFELNSYDLLIIPPDDQYPKINY
ncbi:hypothetical protein [Ekhidna sp.]